MNCFSIKNPVDQAHGPMDTVRWWSMVDQGGGSHGARQSVSSPWVGKSGDGDARCSPGSKLGGATAEMAGRRWNEVAVASSSSA
jgi:hypothetical protein